MREEQKWGSAVTNSVQALTVSSKDNWKSFNVSMLLPSPGQKVKDGTHVWITTGSSLCAPRQSIFNPPVYKPLKPANPNLSPQLPPFYLSQWNQRILRPQTPLVGYKWMWGGDWNCPLEQGCDWGWGGQPWTSEHPTDPLNKQQPLSLFSALEIAFKGLRKILLPIPTTRYIPCQLISHMPEHWLFWA